MILYHIYTFALLDPASTATDNTYIHNSLAEELGLAGERKPLIIMFAMG